MSIVELLVGVAIGLFIVAAATMVLSTQLFDNRKLLLEAQVQQDMRAASEIITRELRRAGYWGHAAEGIWVAGASALKTNPYAAVTQPEGGERGEVQLAYHRGTDDRADNDVVDDRERSGFRLNSGSLQMQVGAGNWQTLTDPATLRVTQFEVNVESQSVPLPCEQTCTSADCPPQINVRHLTVLIEGEAATDAAIRRTVRSTVRLHNDTHTGSCP